MIHPSNYISHAPKPEIRNTTNTLTTHIIYMIHPSNYISHAPKPEIRNTTYTVNNTYHIYDTSF